MSPELSCGRCRDALLEYAAHTLPSDITSAVERHLAGCDACQRALAFWYELGASVREREQRVPVDSGESAGWARLQAALPDNEFSDHIGVSTMLTDEQTAPSQRPERPPTPPRRSWSTRYRWLPALVAVLLVALGVAVFAVAQPRNMATKTSVTQQPKGCAPKQISASLPPHASLSDLEMVSPDEGWAVGYITQDGQYQNAEGLILHYSHCRWVQVPSPAPHLSLGSLSMLSSTDGWALGSDVQAEKSVVLHYTGGQWRVVSLAVDIASPRAYLGPAYSALRMVSPTEGWLVTTYKDQYGHDYEDLFHEMNGKWARVTVPNANGIANVVPIGPDDAWIIAAETNFDPYHFSTTDHLLHYQAGQITLAYTFPPDVGFDNVFQPIQMNGPQDGWISVHTNPNVNPWQTITRFLLHYDGTSWSKVPSEDDSQVQTAAAVSIFSGSDGWAFTADTNPQFQSPSACRPITGALRLTSAGWQSVPWTFQNIWCIVDVVRAAPGEYWSFGSLTTKTDANGRPVESHEVLLHFVNGAWSAYG